MMKHKNDYHGKHWDWLYDRGHSGWNIGDSNWSVIYNPSSFSNAIDRAIHVIGNDTIDNFVIAKFNSDRVIRKMIPLKEVVRIQKLKQL
jgi:hypothetical protein